MNMTFIARYCLRILALRISTAQRAVIVLSYRQQTSWILMYGPRLQQSEQMTTVPARAVNGRLNARKFQDGIIRHQLHLTLASLDVVASL